MAPRTPAASDEDDARNPPRTEADDHGNDDAPETDADEGAGFADEDLDGDDGDDGGEGDQDRGDGTEGGEQGQDAAEVAGQPRRRSASDVIRDNKKARKDAEDRADAADRRAQEALLRVEAAERRAQEAAQSAHQRQAQESEAAEAARVELMGADEKIAYYRQKDREQHQADLQGVRFEVWNSTDRMEFRQLVKDDPLVAKVQSDVEKEFVRLQAAGRPVAREILANQFIAKMVREERKQGGPRQRQAASDRVRRQTVAAPKSRSEVPADRRRRGDENTAEARRKRLEDVTL